MALARAKPLRFTPRSLSDTLDDTNAAPGSLRSFSNLIVDPSTMFCYQCRPAAPVLSTFAGFTAPGVVSVAYALGTLIYGMIASGRNAGKDEPFCYNVLTSSFVAVTGTISGATCPTTQPTAGAWTPPTMDMVGTMLLVTHPGFPGSGVNFGWFDLSTPTAPVWHAGDTATNSIGGVATNVRQYNNRGYISVGNKVWFTDALTNPPTITNASQQLTIDDISPVTAMCPLGFVTTSSAVVLGLLVFKQQLITLITGDSTTSNLAQNAISPQGVGTAAPRSVFPTPQGVYFVDDDGVRVVQLNAVVTDPLPDVQVPFINAVQPSRISAAFDHGTYRVCVQNGGVPGTPFQEYWYTASRQCWTGPHTKRQDMAVPYFGSFIIFDNSNPGKLYQSKVVQDSTVGFTEDGVALSWVYQTAPIADSGDMMQSSSNLSTINLAFKSGTNPVNLTASDESGGVLAQATITPSGLSTIWGAFLWGAALWAGQQYGLRPHLIPWTMPLIFTKLVVQASGVSSPGFKISNLQVMYQGLGVPPPV